MSKRYIPIQRRHFVRRAWLSPGGLLLSFLMFLALVSLTSMVQAAFVESPLSSVTSHQTHSQEQITDSVGAAQVSTADVQFVKESANIPRVIPTAVASNVDARVEGFPLEKVWPTHGRITTLFSSFHPAIDIAISRGTPLHPFASGVVVLAKWWGSFGNAVVIQHVSGWQTIYAHMQSINVAVNQEVNLDSVIGTVGSTGFSTGPHVHFQLSKDGRPVNPLNYLP